MPAPKTPVAPPHEATLAPGELAGEGVSVIIAARDAAATIARAVQSALNQPEAAQILVVDDGSTDTTADVARACDPRGSRVEVLQAPQNLGPAGARNLALERANQPFVAVLDADDIMLPERLGRLMAQAEGFDMVADDLCLSDEASPLSLQGRLLDLPKPSAIDLSLKSFAEANISRAGRSRREMGFLKPLIRRRFLEAHGLRYQPELRLGEDYVLYAQAMAAGAKVRLVDATGYVAVRRPNSLSGRHTLADLAHLHAACLRLAAEAPVDPPTRQALSRHAASVRRKLTHLEVLAQKKDAGVGAALKHLSRRHRDAPYVLAQTLRDKVQARRKP